jgi:hypothetical protein
MRKWKGKAVQDHRGYPYSRNPLPISCPSEPSFLHRKLVYNRRVSGVFALWGRVRNV